MSFHFSTDFELFLLPLREKASMRGDQEGTLTSILSRQGRGESTVERTSIYQKDIL
jgi:hypothetical protein